MNINNLSEFKSFVNALTSEIGRWGGRYFINGGKKYRLNEIVKRFQEEQKKSNFSKTSKQILNQIKKLDEKADSLLSKMTPKIKILTSIKQFFGNLFFNKKKILDKIEQKHEKSRGVQFDEIRNCKFNKEDPPQSINGHKQFFKRKYPPVAAVDTVIMKNGNFESVHGNGKMFSNEEIIKVHTIVSEEKIWEDVFFINAWKTENGKYVIQQQATRGCTAATAAMLIKDHGKEPDIWKLRGRNLGNDKDQMRDIEAVGLRPILTVCKDLDQLKELLRKHGSAIVSISGELGGHVIIVDEIGEKEARIRDPYNGWEITVTLEALKKRFSGGSVIQIS